PGSIELRSRGRIHASHPLRVVGESTGHSTRGPQQLWILERDPAGAGGDCLRLSHRAILFSPPSRCARVFLDPGDHEMKLENGPRLHNPWGFIVVAAVSATVVVAFGLGFLLLPRYQGIRAPFSTKDAVYHALGFHIHDKAFNIIQPPPRVPTYIAWTEITIRQASTGDGKSGEFIATNCTACHGEKGLGTQPWIPSLAAPDRFVRYQQLTAFCRRALGAARQPLHDKTNCIRSSSCKHLLRARAPPPWTCRCERSRACSPNRRSERSRGHTQTRTPTDRKKRVRENGILRLRKRGYS